MLLLYYVSNFGLQVSPVERVVEVWEDSHEEGWVGGLEVVPDHVQDGEHDVEAVRQVEADQQLVKHVPHLRPEMDRD